MDEEIKRERRDTEINQGGRIHVKDMDTQLLYWKA